MDEYSNSGFDPEVTRYFRKIMNSFAMGLLWLLTMGVAGLFFKLAIIKTKVQWFNISFYGFFIISLGLLVWFFTRLWRKQVE